MSSATGRRPETKNGTYQPSNMNRPGETVVADLRQGPPVLRIPVDGRQFIALSIWSMVTAVAHRPLAATPAGLDGAEGALGPNHQSLEGARSV